MTGMHRYVCWTDEAVMASTPRDAASLGPGHFQAVHYPLKLQQRPLDRKSGGRRVEETEVVRVLEGPLRPDGYLLVPVVGRSGTGKSHLVRWVADRTKDRDDWESRYLAKNRTSIRSVIEIVIEGLDGPAIDAAREALESAPARSESAEVLAERLLDELALITSEESGADANVAERRTAQMAAKLRRELPDILRDPVVRRRLTTDGAVIPRLVGLAMRGRSDGDGLDDDAIRVADDDLPLAFEEMGEASLNARRLLGQLGTIPALKSAALGLINEALPSAVKRVFVSDQVDLIGVFRDVRRELLATGKELALFIEDLTVLHGVEGEFLDAIIEPARSPDGDLCGLRVLFAVTEHHFDGLDTVRTRCDDAYWLDAYGPDGIGQQEAMSFLGRYFNACRQDPAEVENLWADRPGDAWMPNACDSCDHQVHCHETFGRSEEGYGLYPYNPMSVDRFVEAMSSERFDPRETVKELVNRFLLVAAADLRRDNFPSDELVGPFNERSEPIDPLVQSKLKAKRPVDFARVVNSMRYWSEATADVGDATLAAFGLDPLEAPETAPTPPPRPKPPRSRRSGVPPEPVGETTLSSRLRSPWSKIFDDLSGWAGNQRSLDASATRNLRELVHKSVLQSLDFSALPINLGTDFDHQERFSREKHLRIAGSVTDQRRGDPIIVIEQDPDTAAALRGLILLAKLPDVDDYTSADTYRRQAARYLEEWTSCVTAKLEQSPEPAATQAIVGLLVCAAVAGACEEATDPYDYLAALFGGTSSTPGAHRSPKWQKVVESADTTYRRLRPVVEAQFGEARGTGGTRAVRADQILTVIRDFTESWRLESDDSAIDRFMRSVRPAVGAEWEVLERAAAGTARLVDASRSWSEQTQRVLELVEAAHRSGRMRDNEATHDLRALAAEQDENAHRDLLRAAELAGAAPPFIERFRVVASRLPDTVATTSRFIARADEAMAGIARDLDERRAGESEGETLEDVVSQVPGEIRRLEAVIKELEK